MKKIQILALSMGLIGAGLFTSCTDNPIDPIGPSIEWIGSNGDEITKQAGETLSVKFQVKEGDASIEKAVAYFVTSGVKETILNTADSSDKAEDGSEYTLTRVLANAGTFQLIVNITDKDGLVGGDTVNIIVEAALTDNGSKILGASGAAEGSYYSVANNLVYQQADAITNVTSINIVYNYNDTDGAMIYSATESSALKDLAGVTETTFAKSTTITFETATASDLESVTPSSTKLTSLAVDDVIVYKTSNGTKGLIKITAITAATNGTATISVKVK